MQPISINKLSRQSGVSTRTLRYYEQIGLLESIREPESGYRTYDRANMIRLSQIVLLRKLRIPIRQIEHLLKSDDALEAIDVFAAHVRGINAEIEALETLRTVVHALVERLSQVEPVKLSEKLLSDEGMQSLIRALPDETTKLKEAQAMSNLNQAEQTLSKLRAARIVYLPPSAVAASHFIGDCPEDVTGRQIFDFAQAVDITRIKPDVRMYGFNHPNPVDETNAHGYEFWLTIPDDMEVPAPLQKKRFEGGLYAAHTIKIGDFHEWALLDRWVRESEEYAYRGGGSPENMFDSLEEHLNIYTHIVNKQDSPPDMQLDLLIPVKKR